MKWPKGQIWSTTKPNWTALWPLSKNKANPGGDRLAPASPSQEQPHSRGHPEGNDRFNVLNHILVPHHELVEIEKETEELSPWNMMRTDQDGNERLAKELLPKILITDPAVQAIKEATELQTEDLPAGWLANRILKIVRHSPSAGSSVAYRLIVESA
ncbi:MAG: hypothetical protein CM15mP48_0220 [Candidatus Poseidoniales archaeon]|nr:MAG: hypothetical protein CM15mP48_0220 [Candidatus Poseidoniales archaeon]